MHRRNKKNTAGLGSLIDLAKSSGSGNYQSDPNLIEGHNLLWWQNRLAFLQSELATVKNKYHPGKSVIDPLIAQIKTNSFTGLFPDMQLQAGQSPLHPTRLPALYIEQLKELVNGTLKELSNAPNRFWKMAWTIVHLEVSVLQAKKVVEKLQAQQAASGDNPFSVDSGNTANDDDSPSIPTNNGAGVNTAGISGTIKWVAILGLGGWALSKLIPKKAA